MNVRIIASAASLLVCSALYASAAEPVPLRSPVVHEDGRVTVSLVAPKAASVTIASGELQTLLGPEALTLAKNDDGVWTATIGPLKPGIYDYALNVDGLRISDPLSLHAMGNRTGTRDYLEVPGPQDAPRIDQWRDVPHGAVTRHWYQSKATGTRRSVHVYTPPGYGTSTEKYPVVYLLHGSGDDDRHWSALGQANVIADNLIADVKAVPAIVVMPEGHPAGGPSRAPRESEERKNYSRNNRKLFAADLLGDVIPLVEANYRAKTNRESRAVVGLSMGGQQSLDVGLNNLDKFAYVGSFSGAANDLDAAHAKLSADPEAFNKGLRVFWIGVGKDDFLLEFNREFTAKLKELGIRHEYEETAGAHTWSVWRGFWADFMPKLFREAPSGPASAQGNRPTKG